MLRRAIRSVRNLHAVVHRLTIGRLGDVRWGFPSRTARRTDLEDVGAASPGRIFYLPSPWGTLRRILPQSEITPDDVFLDLGSGMGRVLFQAARYRFKRVIGVEAAAQFTEVANHVLRRQAKRLRCGDLEIRTADARSYVIPDDTTVVYLYHPFEGSLFDAVVSNIVASVDRSPRRVRLIYTDPILADRLLATGRARFVRTWRRGWLSGRPPEFVRLYEME